MSFKPMLACKANPAKLRFPLYVQPKLDGIRASVVDGKLLTRTLKQVPNREVYAALSRPEFNGLDGELIVGPPTAEDCYRQTASFCMSANKTGATWVYFIFDRFDIPSEPFKDRYIALADYVDALGAADIPFQIVPAFWAPDAAELEQIEEVMVNDGHEGAILRQPNAPYKFGRASATAGELVKLKRFSDSEAEIIGCYEEQHNANEAKRNALGRTERSTAQTGKVAKGTLGGFIVRDCYSGVEFRVGSGFNASERVELWQQREQLIGKIIRYSYFPVGGKDRPRHPVVDGFREAGDLPSSDEGQA